MRRNDVDREQAILTCSAFTGVRALLLGESGTKVDLELARAAPQDNEYPVYQV